MHSSPLLLLLATACIALARSTQHVGKIPRRAPIDHAPTPPRMHNRAPLQPRTPKRLTNKTEKFHVDGTKLPDVDFDIGESYAGLLPISKHANETRQLYFWYFPSSNPDATNETTIWLNGGPGCSSLEGLLQENGPFLWQYGTYKPVPNPWTWVNLTNMLWVEQPVGTGFSQGLPQATTETEVARDFMGFFENFVDTFDLHDNKVFISGESYAGQYVPYIASAMLDTNNTKYFDVEATMIYDPTVNSFAITNQIPAVAFVDYWGPLIGLNQTFMDYLHKQADTCGYTAYLNDNLVYPPKGKLPSPPNLNGDQDGCDLATAIQDAATLVNPCFDIYQVATTCPLLWDVLGFPGSFDYLPYGAKIYFDRPEVKKAINAPQVHWEECSSKNVFNTSDGISDESNNNLFSGLTVLPGVIDRSKRTVIGHGNLDILLMINGTLLTIQNMTFGGMQGFQKPVTEDFYVPYHTEYQDSTLAASGVMGKTHTERGLTFVEVNLSGHMIPQYQPSAAFRHLEFLLGRVPSLSSKVPFTTSNDELVAQPDAPQRKHSNRLGTSDLPQ